MNPSPRILVTSPYLTKLRIMAGTIMWSLWGGLFLSVCYHNGLTNVPILKQTTDLMTLSVFAWLILMDDPPANYPSYHDWRAVRKARLAKRTRWFTPLPPSSS